jgi:ferredoxin-NADP reductase/MOSC domain-containing protein YiiM
MARLLSVNVGLPRDIAWRGRTVHTAIWKEPVAGRRMVRRLNIEGDGQGDRAGHGGEQRAVYAYQIESYRHWEKNLGRRDFTYGQFGENFTIAGLADDEVAVGDRYRIGAALLEVTQPRVTCYRLGIRMDEPRMAALLTGSGKPGFYLRVLEEGEVGAGDEIVKVGADIERMTIAQANALLYLPEHPRGELERALRIAALSPGWRSSFQALLEAAGRSGNAGLAPASARPAAAGFASMRVARIDRESVDVISLLLERTDGLPLALPLAGQFVVLRLNAGASGSTLFRSYSLSDAPGTDHYRVSVKLEPNGVAGGYLHGRVRLGDVLDVSAPRGNFVLAPGDGPLALVSAGIGSTPVLAMLHALSATRSQREVWWLHSARNGKSHAFAADARRLVGALARGRSHVAYSRPEPGDVPGRDFDEAGRLDAARFEGIGLHGDGDFYLCGPASFMRDLTAGLTAWGVAASRIHTETFGGGEALTPGIVSAAPRTPHSPAGAPSTGPLVSFARSGIAVRWDPLVYQNLLELAEACDVPVRWSCRTGVCHNCESGLVSGAVAYQPDPLDAPAEGNILICCSRPRTDVVIDI